MVRHEASVIFNLRESIKLAGSIRKWATLNGFSASYISKVLRKKEIVSERLAELVGYRKIEYWELIKRAHEIE